MSKFKVILRVCKDFGENTSILGKHNKHLFTVQLYFIKQTKTLLSQGLEMLLKPRHILGQPPGW